MVDTSFHADGLLMRMRGEENNEAERLGKAWRGSQTIGTFFSTSQLAL